MAVSAINSTSAVGAASATTGSAASSATQDRFLKVLVAQMQSQDPMNPMDNAQVTSQMAQISTVNGIENLNSTVASLASQFGAVQSLQGAALLGRSVAVTGNSMDLASGAASGAYQLASAADRVVVNIKDAAGNVVHSVDLGAQPAGTAAFEWDGKNDAGAQIADGRYTFAIEATKAGQAVTAGTLAVANVLGISRDAGSLALDLGSLGTHSISEIQRIQ